MKKSLPLNLRRTLEEILDENREIIKIDSSSDSIIDFIDLDASSNFAFEISEMKLKNGTPYYSIRYLPQSANDLSKAFKTCTLSDLKKHLENWVNLLKEFNKPSILFEGDNIEKAYFDELEPIVEILEEDADTNPFTYSQQQKLIELYDSTIQQIEEAKTEKNTEQSNQLIDEIEVSKKLITKSTKKEVVNRIRKNLARVRKFSFQIFEKSLVKFLSDVGKKLMSGEIDITTLLP